MGNTGNASLEIVLPCYNPRPGWEQRIIQSIQKIREALPEMQIGIVLVNDGSNNGVTENDFKKLEASLSGLKVISYEKNGGKGHALRQGVAATQSPIIIYTDVDFPYEEQSLISLYQLLRNNGGDVVAGVRDDAYYAKVPGGRKRISKFLRWMLRTFLRLRLTDTQCGLKGFNEKGKQIFLNTRIRRFLFDLEFIYLSSNEPSLVVKPVQVALKPGIEFTRVNWRILFTESLNFFRIVAGGIFRRLFGRRKK